MFVLLNLVTVLAIWHSDTVNQHYDTGGSHASKLATRGVGAPAKWTVMVFMNGDNNLENDALINFRQMAKVSNSSAVNIVVEMDRIGKYAHTEPDWTQTLRFKLSKGMSPLKASAVEDLGEQDMGDTATLHKFVIWSKKQYPADHYLLIIWDHGQGWRFRFAPSTVAASEHHDGPDGPLAQSPYRSISQDETNGNHKLYNRGIQDALKGEQIDIIGFDACLMSMVEAAYAFRSVGTYMVASEELIPGLGWRYDDWLSHLVQQPSMTPESLARELVDSYRRTYELDEPTTTLAAIDLGKVQPLVTAVSALADALREQLSAHHKEVFDARSSVYEYAPDPFGDGLNYFHHVDLGRFVGLVSDHLTMQKVRIAADAAAAALQEVVIANYAGAARQKEYGSTGLAIYFPLTGTDYKNDVFEESGYEKANQFWPVAFVQESTWPEFLHAYFAVVK